MKLTEEQRKRAAKAIVETYLGFPAPDREPCDLDFKAADAAFAAASAPVIADAAINPEDVGLPPYPKGHVIGPCVCGSWSGGECLKCPVIPGSEEVIADTAKPAQVIPQGVMGIPPNPPGSGSMTINHDILSMNASPAIDAAGAKPVALYAAFDADGNLLAHSKFRQGLSDILNWEPLYRAASPASNTAVVVPSNASGEAPIDAAPKPFNVEQERQAFIDSFGDTPDGAPQVWSGFQAGYRAAIDAAGASEGQEPVAWADKRDIERLRSGTLTIAGAGAKQSADNVPLYTHPSAEIAALRERIAGMENDAERYRKIKRDTDACKNETFCLFFDDEMNNLVPVAGKDMDSQIDAAIAKEPKEKCDCWRCERDRGDESDV